MLGTSINVTRYVSNRIRSQLTRIFNNGESITLRCKVRWLKGNRFMLMRLRSNMAEAQGDMIVPLNLGLPVRATAAMPPTSDLPFMT